jgi:hypothetical protein
MFIVLGFLFQRKKVHIESIKYFYNCLINSDEKQVYAMLLILIITLVVLYIVNVTDVRLSITR